MTPIEARELLYQDAHRCYKHCMSVSEWEERIEEEPYFREAVTLLGNRAIEAISALIWSWDSITRKVKV